MIFIFDPSFLFIFILINIMFLHFYIYDFYHLLLLF